MFDPYAQFERQKSVFYAHPFVYEQVELKAAADLELPTGAIIKIVNGTASLATDNLAVDDNFAVVFGPVTLNATTKTSTVIVRHCEVVKDQVIVASGASIDTIAAVCAKKGIYIH